MNKEISDIKKALKIARKKRFIKKTSDRLERMVIKSYGNEQEARDVLDWYHGLFIYTKATQHDTNLLNWEKELK